VTRCVRRWLAGLFGAAWLLLTVGAAAHELSMAELEIRQATPGEFVWQWTARSGADDRLRPQWPDGCAEDAGVVRCARGLDGRLGMEGVGQRASAVIVRIHWLDGQRSVHTISAGQPSVRLYGAADDARGLGEIATAYGVLGVEHILSGFDHLLFVLGLLFLVGFERRLVWTITAFTAAHSVTLVLSSLGWLRLSPPPVEATIALSILLVAGEALNREPTLTRRWPAAVAFLFGLVHGLGFAGALEQVGLPERHLSVALLTFNLGVEAGQLAVVLAAWLVVRLLGRRPALAPMRTAALYAMGGQAGYWSIGRIAAIVA
jgi:hydrogenase/urease accessory protein HupE